MNSSQTEHQVDPLKVLFVNRSYWPDMEATGQLLTELCDDLAQDPGFDITVLCGQPNSVAEHQKKAIEECRRASGNRFEIRNNVKIKRVKHTTFDKGSFLGRSINFVSFCLSAFFRLLWCQRVDLIVCETDPPIAVIFTRIAAKLRGIKMVCYLQDIYPDIAVKVGKIREGWFAKLIRYLLLRCYRKSDAMIVLSQDMKAWLVEKGIEADKVFEIHNWVDTKKIKPVKAENEFRQNNQLEDKFVVMYSGNMGQTQDFQLLLDSIERLKNHDTIHFCFIGGGVRQGWLEQSVKEMKAKNVTFHPYQPRNALAISLSAADLQIVMLSPLMTQLMMPSKLYSALATGTPILAICECQSHLARIVTEANAGFCIEEGNSQGLADRILHLCNSSEECQTMGSNARELAIKKYDRSISVQHFRELLAKFGGERKHIQTNAEHADPSLERISV